VLGQVDAVVVTDLKAARTTADVAVEARCQSASLAGPVTNQTMQGRLSGAHARAEARGAHSGKFGACDVDDDKINIERPIFKLVDAGLGADFAMNRRGRWVGIDAFGIPASDGNGADGLAKRADNVEKAGDRIVTPGEPPEFRR